MEMTDQESIQQAAQAIQDGDRETGRRLLLGIVRANPHNAQAWLLMSGVVDSEEEQRDCLLRTLDIEPDNSAAQMELAWLDLRLQGEAPSATEAEATSATSERALHPAVGPREPPESVRVSGFRNTMLAGAMVLTLLCGLTLLVVTVTRVVPVAQARMRPTPETILYTATLWCPACEQDNAAIVLWERVGDGVSRGAKVGELKHNTAVSVLAEAWSKAEEQTYLKVAAQGQKGWVPAAFVRKQSQVPDDSR
jgi:hypothetical protein